MVPVRLNGTMESNNGTASRKITHNLQSRIDVLTTELAKTRLALWDEVGRRRKAEQSLRELEEMHYRILETTGCGILISDGKGQTIKTNDCLQNITGYSAEELREKGLSALSPNPVDRRELHRIFTSMDQVQDREILLKRKNDTTCTVLLNINRTELNGQKILITRVQDITAWKHHEETLTDSMKQSTRVSK